MEKVGSMMGMEGQRWEGKVREGSDRVSFAGKMVSETVRELVGVLQLKSPHKPTTNRNTT